MATIAKRVLSGSDSGMPITVSATAGGVTTVHQGTTSTNILDEVWVYAYNSGANAVNLTLEFGASASQVLRMEVEPILGPQLVMPGFIVQGRSTAVSIFAYASASNTINLVGYVNRITQ